MKEYKVVPNIISTKDLGYLSDMFQWNYIPYKFISDSIDRVEDVEISKMLDEGAKLFDDNMSKILDILGGTYD